MRTAHPVYSFLCCMILSCFCPPLFSAPQAGELTKEKKLLEIEKLKHEVARLEQENKLRKVTFWLSLGGSLLGGLGFAWTVFTGLRSFKQRTLELRNARISRLLENLSSESIAARLGAVRSLKPDVDHAANEILAASELEIAPPVRQAMIDTLSAGGSVTFRVLIESNRATLQRRGFLLERVHALDPGLLPEFARRAGFDEATGETLRLRYKPFFPRSNRSGALRPDSPGDETQDWKEVKQSMLHSISMAELTNTIISKLIREGRDLPLREAELDLTEANLYGGRLSKTHLVNSFFTRSIMHEMEWFKVDLTRAVLTDSKLAHSRFRECNLKESLLAELNWRESKLYQMTFTDCDLTAAVLSASALTLIQFVGGVGDRLKLNGSRIGRSSFRDISLQDLEMQGASVFRCDLAGASLFRANLRACYFRELSGQGMKLNGANLERARFRECDLRDVNFSGTELDGTRFERCRLDGADFRHSHHFDRAKFDPPLAGDATIVR